MKLAKGFLTHEMDGETVMAASGEAAKKFVGLVRANAAASLILECLKQETDLETIADKLYAEFDAPRDVLRRDAEKVIYQLRSIGAIDE